MMRFILGLLVCATIAGAALNGAVAADDEERPQGEWFLASIDVQGKTLPAPVGKGGSIVFAPEGKLVLKDPGKPERIGKYKIDAGKEPKQIDLIVSKGGKEGEAMQGIYEFDGEDLKMAFSVEGPKGKRPSEFEGENVVVVLWKRQKT